MNILILGNGFDIAHGLDTRYTDFLNYCQAQFYKLPGYKPSPIVLPLTCGQGCA